MKKWTKQYGDRVEIFFGNMKYADDCRKLSIGADYVVNMAAVIPPLADRRPDLARDVNVTGVKKGERVVSDGAHKVRRGMKVEAAK